MVMGKKKNEFGLRVVFLAWFCKIRSAVYSTVC